MPVWHPSATHENTAVFYKDSRILGGKAVVYSRPPRDPLPFSTPSLRGSTNRGWTQEVDIFSGRRIWKVIHLFAQANPKNASIEKRFNGTLEIGGFYFIPAISLELQLGVPHGFLDPQIAAKATFWSLLLLLLNILHVGAPKSQQKHAKSDFLVTFSAILLNIARFDPQIAAKAC